MRRFVPLTRKINLIIVISLVVGIGIVIAYFAFAQNRSLAETAESNLTQQSDILYQSIKNAMLPGEAPIAVQLFADIRRTNPAYEILLYRAAGVEAFSDNSTLQEVNRRLGRQVFEPKTVFPPNRMKNISRRKVPPRTHHKRIGSVSGAKARPHPAAKRSRT